MENLNKENNKIVEELNNNDRIIEEMLKERESIIINDFKPIFRKKIIFINKDMVNIIRNK